MNAIIEFVKQLLARWQGETPKFWITLRWTFGIITILAIAAWFINTIYPYGLDHVIITINPEKVYTWNTLIVGFINFSFAIWGASFAAIKGVWDSIQKKIVPVEPKKDNDVQNNNI